MLALLELHVGLATTDLTKCLLLLLKLCNNEAVVCVCSVFGKSQCCDHVTLLYQGHLLACNVAKLNNHTQGRHHPLSCCTMPWMLKADDGF